MKTLNEVWNADNRRFEALLSARYDDGKAQPQARLFEAMNYSLLAGGKRLRPFLVYRFCALCGGRPEDADNVALAVEMIHTYSLIHDDLPAMDNDDYRRGKLTNHKVYGEALAILAGDALLTDAFRTLVQAALPTDRLSACVDVLSVCAGPYGMVGGQVLDMEAEERDCTEQEVLDIQNRKTGALIRAACELGVLCGGGSAVQREAARAYADNLGLAFQITDDILDVTGSAEALGKAVGVDAEKNTFVKLYGVEGCRAMVREKTEAAISALSCFENRQVLEELARFLADRDR